MTSDPRLSIVVPSPSGPAADADAQLERSAEQWRAELLAMSTAGVDALNAWLEDTGLSQSAFARVTRAYLPADDFKRSIGPSTRSRYNDPRRFWHASFAVLATMAHVSQHRWVELARHMQAAGDRARMIASGMSPAEYDARATVREALIERVTDLLPHLTERQLNDTLIYLGIQARENLSLRVDAAETGATPLGADLPNMEPRAAGRAARADLANWAERLKQRRRDDARREEAR